MQVVRGAAQPHVVLLYHCPISNFGVRCRAKAGGLDANDVMPFGKLVESKSLGRQLVAAVSLSLCSWNSFGASFPCAQSRPLSLPLIFETGCMINFKSVVFMPMLDSMVTTQRARTCCHMLGLQILGQQAKGSLLIESAQETGPSRVESTSPFCRIRFRGCEQQVGFHVGTRCASKEGPW